MSKEGEIKKLEQDWAENTRWQGVTRDYIAADVVRLRGSVQIEHTLARRGAEKLWKLVNEEDYINCLGAVTGDKQSNK
jgi:isocitrate lyase